MQRRVSKMQILDAEDAKLRPKSLKTIALGGKKTKVPPNTPIGPGPRQYSLSFGKRQLQLAAA